MICTCIGIFLLVLAGFLLWSFMSPKTNGPYINAMSAAPSAFLEVSPHKALEASKSAPVLLVSGSCGYCSKAKSHLVNAGINKNVLLANASQQVFSQVAGLNGVPALISNQRLVAMGASPELYKQVSGACPKAAQAAYDKHK